IPAVGSCRRSRSSRSSRWRRRASCVPATSRRVHGEGAEPELRAIPMAVEGKLDLLRLPEVLQVISQQRKTGILTVQGDEDIIAVSFFQGRVVAADALNEGTAEGLGAVLVEQGRIEAGALHRLASRADAEGRRFADVLVEEGH